MFNDFEFEDDGRQVLCSRGVPNPAAGNATDERWWYLSVTGALPTRLRRVTPGETRREVWESALNHLDHLATVPG